MATPLRVLHFPTNYPDPDYGQPLTMVFVAEHVRAAALFHSSVVLYVSPMPSRSGRVEVTRTDEAGVHVIRIHTPRTDIEYLNRGLVYWAVAKELVRLVAQGFSPQVIHAHIFSGAKIPAALSRITNVPLVVTEHWSALCREGLLSARRLKEARRIYEQANMVLPVSSCLSACIQRNTGAEFEGRVIFNAVDTRVFYDFGEGRKNQIVCVMRLEPPKDVPTLLKAFALLRDKHVSLKIVGAGNASPYIPLAAELGITARVEFLGGQTKPTIAALMNESSAFVLSTLWDNSPCVIGEALCCGLPVVATKVGGVHELVGVGDGLLVAPSDAAQMVCALEDVLQKPEHFDRKAIARNARGRFGYEVIGAQLDEVYREVAHAR